jgi:chemotaxis protein methyltransferase CheR
MAQKMQILAEDVSAAREPTSQELEAWFGDHTAIFEQPARVTFRTLYFSPDKRGPRAREDAQKALARLEGKPVSWTGAASLADPFMFQDYMADRTSDLAKEFGPAFAKALFERKPGTWTGPIESGYGWQTRGEPGPGLVQRTASFTMIRGEGPAESSGFILTSEQFERARRLASSLAGIELRERHRELLDRKGRRLGIGDEAGLDALLDAAETGDEAAGRRLIGLFTTSFTGFFRHPWHFDIAAEHALWAAHRRGRARLWSAAAATGAEPFSLAMALIELFRRDDPPAMILATDVDTDALDAARRGEYAERALRGLSPERRARFLEGPVGPGRWRIAVAPRNLVQFREGNLASSTRPAEGPFDVVFCRNVLMYLEEGRRHAILERIASVLAADGLLILDPAEHPGRAARLFAPGGNGVYSRHWTSRGQSHRMPASAARGRERLP